jgi:site-specific DNA-methyltransferase (adenine-specific)
VGLGDSAELIPKNLDKNSVHAVVTDPPYGLNFLNLNWDKVLPPLEVWAACFEVMRPGAFCLAFGHARVYHRLGCQLENVGFRIKDCLCWGYASAFPHSLDIKKTTKDESWDGWGTQLKTAWEPIIIAQKPLEGTYAENVLKYKIGGFNIDECRIPFKDEADKKKLESFEHFAGKNYGDDRFFSANVGGKKQCNIHPDGRWPANLIWLDSLFVQYDHIFMIPKPSRSEKGDYNAHSTVKPVELMERLIRLVTPRPSIVKEKVVVLDPFLGSGSTGVASRNLGRDFVGYERDPASYKVAYKRIKERVRDYPDMFAV